MKKVTGFTLQADHFAKCREFSCQDLSLFSCMRNLAISESGAEIVEFSSQYHHESRCSNLLLRDASLVWFTHVSCQPPHFVVMKFADPSVIHRVGVYLHGENNQNPRIVNFYLSMDGSTWENVTEGELEHRAGDHLFDLENPMDACFIKLEITENFGGSGIYVSKLYAFGTPKL
ncbi:hypothetical protein GEMRC1_008614 [Eukaryota sp. GEM-RC1]